ncbi:MAG TPA: hypothetical protein VMM77_12460 [Gemmatimonadaceae bacterium]|nr:hypothetical protein [Gemmatimonadaceae bacterium]
MINHTRCPISLIVIAATMLSPSYMRAQNLPGKVHIFNAAQQMNSIMPQAVPQQTIEIGTFNGSTNTFHFLLEPSYPPQIPDYKKEEYGGDVPPQYVAEINSYNVKYEFAIVDRPAGFGITIALPEPDGSVVKEDATITNMGTRASVTFNPRAFGVQLITIHRPGGDTTVRVYPRLRPQLGAFVVPYQLISIVYEPPGLGAQPGFGSSSMFEQTSTANTVVSWDFARTSGLVETTTTGGMFDMFGQALGLGAGAILGHASNELMLDALKAAAEGNAAGAKTAGQASQSAAGAVPILAAVNIIADLAEQTEVTTTTTNTTGTTNTQGISISVGASYKTKMHQYPGGGDLFIVLHDVLYSYLAHNGKVYLAPIAYSGVNYYSAAELRQKLPSVAEQFIALNPHLSNPPLYPVAAASQSTSKGARRLDKSVITRDYFGTQSSFGARFIPFESLECKASGSPGGSYSREDFQSTGVSQTRSQTVVEHVTGLAALISGGGDKVQGTTYSTAMQQGTGQEQATSIELDCGANDQFWVDVYLDKLFRTFFTLRGEATDTSSGAAPLTGTAHRPDGSAAARQNVRLKIGGDTYVVLSDNNGNFSFPVRTLPHGTGQIDIGGEKYTVSYTGMQRNLLLRGGVVVDKPVTPTAAQPPKIPTNIKPPARLPGRRP